MNGSPLSSEDTTRLHWVRTDLGRAVAIPDGFIALEPTFSTWRCVVYMSDAKRSILVKGVLYRFAKDRAERYIRSIRAEDFADPRAPWRRDPVTGDQLAVLHRQGIDTGAEMTAGEASDLIASGVGRWRR